MANLEDAILKIIEEQKKAIEELRDELDECINYGDGPFNTYEEAEEACINELTKQQNNEK